MNAESVHAAPLKEGHHRSLWSDEDLVSWRIPIDDLKDVNKIGKGGFATVWLVEYRKHKKLASKRLIQSGNNRKEIWHFVEEIRLVGKLEHSKIIGFVGVAWTRENDLQALFEFMERGDLRTYVEQLPEIVAWHEHKLAIALDVIEALAYVHSFNPPLVHRDLKSRNVLLNADLTAKLSDYGISRYESENNTMSAHIGTTAWLAPEVLARQRDYDHKCDIWAFGVLLSELGTHKPPYYGVMGSDGHPISDFGIQNCVANGQLKPSFLATCPEKLRAISQRCLEMQATDRPKAIEVAYVLRQIRTEMTGSSTPSTKDLRRKDQI